MHERPRLAPKRLTGSGPAPCIGILFDWLGDSRYHFQIMRGAMSMGGVVVAGDQVLPLALGLFGDLGIEIQNDEA